MLTTTDKIVAAFSPQRAAKRVMARAALGEMVAYYDAAGTGKRQGSWRPARGDANAAGGRRSRLSFISRDMVRNNPVATGAVQTIVGHTVGSGIMPMLQDLPEDLKDEGKARLKAYLTSNAIDWRGRETLAGLQRLIMAALATDGELLGILHPNSNGGYPQIEVLEIDHLDSVAWQANTDGGHIQDGIEYNSTGQRVAYYIFDEHPGAQGFLSWKSRRQSQRVDARFVSHIYRQDRPGQERGVSWFAPVALPLQDLADYDDAQLMRQKIAACFTIFRHTDTPGKAPTSVSPGAVVEVSGTDGYEFASPPGVDGYDEFTRGQLRRIATGLGITYEALSKDLSRVNFSSAKMGRLEMDRNVASWQSLILIDQFLAPLGRLFLQAWALEPSARSRAADILGAKIDWVPPARIMIDPSKEIPPLIEEVRAGFQSRQRAITSLGRDPDLIQEEIEEDQKSADKRGLIFDTDGRYHAKPAPPIAGATETEANAND